MVLNKSINITKYLTYEDQIKRLKKTSKKKKTFKLYPDSNVIISIHVF